MKTISIQRITVHAAALFILSACSASPSSSFISKTYHETDVEHSEYDAPSSILAY